MLVEWDSHGTPNLPVLMALMVEAISIVGPCGAVALPGSQAHFLVIWGHIMYQLLKVVGIIHIDALRDREENVQLPRRFTFLGIAA
jgi:hypothetical protein